MRDPHGHRVELVDGVTINDVYAGFVENCVAYGAERGEQRSRADLQSVIHAAGLRYEDCGRLSVRLDWAVGDADDSDARVAAEAD